VAAIEQENVASKSFVRQSSGLIREFGVGDVILINIIGVNIGIVLAVSIASLAGLWPGASMILVVILGAIVSLATVGVYGMLSATMPRAGGDYVFIGRGLSPWLGFTANWMMTFSLFVLFGLFSVGTITQAIAPALAAYGLLANDDSIVSFATKISTDKTILAFCAVGLMLAAAAVALAGDRVVKWVFRILAAVGIGGVLILIVVLLTTDYATFVNNMNEALSRYQGGTIEGMRAAADKGGFSPVSFSIAASFSALPFAFYSFVGLTYTSYLGGEIQRPQRSQPIGMLIALGVSLLLFVLLFIGVYQTMGWDNIHAWASLAGSDPTAIKFFNGSVLGSFLLGVTTGSPFLAAIMVLMFAAWFFMILLWALMMPIRNLFAWSMDGILPQAVTKVSRRGTPWVATIIVGVVGVAMAIIAVYSTFISLVVNYTLLYSTTFLLAGICAVVFPYRRRELFEKAPAFVQTKIGGIPLLTIAGVVESLTFLVIIYEALKTPAFGGPTGNTALLLIGGLLLAGPVVFFVSRWIRIRQGYDVDAAFRTLPPE